MSELKLITPTQERMLSDSLVSAIKRVNGGMTPNDALAKSANDHGLTPQFACRMVEAYNASKTVSHLQKTAGEQRAQDFVLADRDEVLKIMYAPAAVKQAAGTDKVKWQKTPEQKKQVGNAILAKLKAHKDRGELTDEGEAELASGHYDDLAYIPERHVKKACESTIFATKLQNPNIKAKGVSETEKKKKDKDGPGDNAPKIKTGNLRENKFTKLASMLTQLDRMGSEIRMELAQAKDNAVKCACTLESLLRTPGHEAFEEIEKRVVSTYGVMGKKAMDIVWGLCDFERFGEKRASAPDRLYVMGTGPAYDCARELMASLEKAAKIDQEFKNFNDKKRQVQKLLPESSGQQPGGTGATFVSDPGMPRRPATAPLVDEAEALKGSTKDHPEKTAKDDSLLSPEKLMGEFTTKPETPKSIFDPAHEAKIRAIRAKVVVNDMIANDPTLSAYPPEHVFNAYNEVARVSPGLANEPLMIRSLVGRTMQTGGRLDQNEVKQLLDAEKTHREIRVKGY
jgi:hypothetical protein